MPTPASRRRIASCQTPVSYTHLDVYKRQELNERALKILKQDKKNEADCGMDGAWTGHPLSLIHISWLRRISV